MRIMVTGGAGYIGSHTCIALLQAGHEVVALDNLSKSKSESLARVRAIAGKGLTFHQIDLLDEHALSLVFSAAPLDGVIHFAGLKGVAESAKIPLEFYHNNISGTLNLCQAMAESSCRILVFSSSAAVYGNPHAVPITEEFPLHATNPFGRTKLMIEEVLRDLHASDPAWKIAMLRYFNPAGAHRSGMLGEDPDGAPGTLFASMAQVAIGRLEELSVFGNDYATPDGTGVRDYIHVEDVADAHVRVVESLAARDGISVYNLGTGQGHTVLQMIAAFEQASGKKIPYKIAARRPGDIATSFADISKARLELGWGARRSIEEMCSDTWRWQTQNPKGY